MAKRFIGSADIEITDSGAVMTADPQAQAQLAALLAYLGRTNTVYLNTLALSGTPAALSPVEKILTVTLSAPATNVGNVILAAGGGQVVLLPGEWHIFQHIDLATLTAAGQNGDSLSIVGGTW